MDLLISYSLSSKTVKGNLHYDYSGLHKIIFKEPLYLSVITDDDTKVDGVTICEKQLKQMIMCGSIYHIVYRISIDYKQFDKTLNSLW